MKAEENIPAIKINKFTTCVKRNIIYVTLLICQYDKHIREYKSNKIENIFEQRIGFF